MEIDKATKTKNTDELFAYLKAGLDRAERDSSANLREIARKSARDSEWHTLFSCMCVPAIAAIYDTIRIAKRLDEIRADLMREHEAARAVNGY